MSTQDGQKSCHQGSRANAQSIPKISQMLSPAQIQLLDYTDALDGPDLVKSLKLLHNIAVYHSSEPLDEAEKDALFYVKGLWECIERVIGDG